MTATEFLGPILTRASAYSETEHGTDLLRHQGVRMSVFRADLFQSLSGFVRDAAVLSERAGRITPVDPSRPVRIPGEGAAKTRALRERDGIPVSEDDLRSLRETAEAVGVEWKIRSRTNEEI